MAYARSNLNKVGAVTAVHYLLHGTTFASSRNFQSLHVCLHLQDLNEEEGYLTVLKKDDSYMSFNVTKNYTLRLTELENENLYDYTEHCFITGKIPKDVDKNSNCMLLLP